MSSNIAPELRIKATLASLVFGCQNAIEAVDRNNMGSFMRWIDVVGNTLVVLGPEVEKYIQFRNKPPVQSIEDRLKKDTGN